MKNVFKFLVEKFGFIFQDYPLLSGVVLLCLASIVIYLLRNRIFYDKNRKSILQHIINLRTIFIIIGFYGFSQIIKGLNIYDSISGDLLSGLKVLFEDFPIVAGSIITAIGIFLVFDKLKPINKEPFNKDYKIENYDDQIYNFKFWAFTGIITLIGLSMIVRNEVI